MIEILWWILLVLLLGFGFLGCFINKVPGPIAVALATIISTACLGITDWWPTVVIAAVLAIVSMILSKVLVKAVKKLHAFSKRGSTGTTIGSIIGLMVLVAVKDMDSAFAVVVIAVAALIIIPFIFAFLLELTTKVGAPIALKCAGAATAAYVSDTFLKILVFAYAIYAIIAAA